MFVTVRSLHCYPIKSCAGIDLTRVVVESAGLAWDRRWLLADPDGVFLTQRTHPRMALIRPTLGESGLRIDAPGMTPLTLALDAGLEQAAVEIGVWQARVLAHKLDAGVNRWFSDALGSPCALYRVAEPMLRQPDPAYVAPWTQLNIASDAEMLPSSGFGFADGFPILVASQASLDDLNARLDARGRSPVEMKRFRPNIVVDGIEAFDEDHIAWLDFSGLRIGLVKACARCSVPDVDPDTGTPGLEPGHTLATFRQFDSGILFGQNAIVASGAGRLLEIGDAGDFEYAF